MNNIFLFDSQEAPVPPDRMAIKHLKASPYPDGSRVRMELRVTPFLERPNLEIYAKKVGGPIVAEMSVIETMTPELEFTLHIRGVDSFEGEYILHAELYYEERTQPQAVEEITFTIKPEASPE